MSIKDTREAGFPVEESFLGLVHVLHVLQTPIDTKRALELPARRTFI